MLGSIMISYFGLSTNYVVVPQHGSLSLYTKLESPSIGELNFFLMVWPLDDFLAFRFSLTTLGYYRVMSNPTLLMPKGNLHVEFNKV